MDGYPGNADVDLFCGTLEELHAYAAGEPVADLTEARRLLDLADAVEHGEET